MTTHKITWQKFTVEAVVIVFSILLAFAIDTAWDQRQQLSEQQELLRGLHGELAENKLIMDTSRANTLRALDNLKFFLAGPESGDAAKSPADLWDSVYRPLMRQFHESLPTGFLETATNSGKLTLVTDPVLSAALARLSGRHTHINDIRMLIGEHDISTAAVLGEYEGIYRQFGQADDEFELDADTLRALRTDPRLTGAATAKISFMYGYLGLLAQLESTIDETIALIGDAVER